MTVHRFCRRRLRHRFPGTPSDRGTPGARRGAGLRLRHRVALRRSGRRGGTMTMTAAQLQQAERMAMVHPPLVRQTIKALVYEVRRLRLELARAHAQLDGEPNNEEDE